MSMKEVVEMNREVDVDNVEGMERDTKKIETGNEEKSMEETTTGTANLKIAWQYEKYLHKETNPLTNVRGKPSRADNGNNNSKNSKIKAKTNYCCSYDISSRLQPFLLKKNPPFLLNKDDKTYTQLMHEIEQFIKENSVPDNKYDYGDNDTGRYAVRVFIPRLCGYSSRNQSSCTDGEMTKLLLSVKHSLRNNDAFGNASLYLTLQPSNISPNLSGLLLRTISDYSLSLESLAGRYRLVPSEFKDFLGFLNVRKIQQYGQLASIRPSYNKYGLKRDRRKLYIEPLHLPPDDGEKGRGETLREAKPKSVAAGHISTDDTSGSSGIRLQFERDDNYDSQIKSAPDREVAPVSTDITNQPVSHRVKPVTISSFQNSNVSGRGGVETGAVRPKFNLAQSKAKAASMLQQGTSLSANSDSGGDCSGIRGLNKKNLDF